MDQEMIDCARELQTRFQATVTKLAIAQAKWILKAAAKQHIDPNRPDLLTIEIKGDADVTDPTKATFFQGNPVNAPNAMTIILLKHFGLDWRGPRSYGLASPKTLYYDFTIVPIDLSS